jgi:hypothetical protein
MRVGMHTENEITPKAKNNVLTRCQGENLVGYGGRKRRSGQFIAFVGYPSGQCFDDVRTRAASERSKTVTHVRTD